MKKWTLNSWREYPVKHIPKYEDEKELSMVLKKIGSFPPLVFAGETRALKKSLAQVAEGKAFLLQGGDCAESFAEFHPDNIRDTFKVILITNEKNKIISENIRFTLETPMSNEHLTPFLMTIPLQLLAYHVASLKNCDIDKPRNLAKSVTVE